MPFSTESYAFALEMAAALDGCDSGLRQVVHVHIVDEPL